MQFLEGVDLWTRDNQLDYGAGLDPHFPKIMLFVSSDLQPMPPIHLQ